jgi:GNAT superfamily N-acetyltransferase
MHKILLNKEKHKHIRNFRYSDAEQCCGIINACIQSMDGLNDDARSFLLRKNTSKALAAELLEYYSLVYDDEQVIKALGSLDGNEIKRMYVHPALQGQGIGTLLLHSLEVEASRQNITTLHLQSSPSAVRFYRRQGFTSLNAGSMIIDSAVFKFINMSKAVKDINC